MASTADLVNYSVCQSISRILEIEKFSTKTSKTDMVDDYILSDDGSFEFWIDILPCGFQQGASLGGNQIDSDFVYISLHNDDGYLPEFWVKLCVSLIDVKGEKQFPQTFGKTSSQLRKEGILSRFTSRASILASPATYLHNGTLKVLFEVFFLKPGTSALLTPLSKDYASLLSTGSLSDVTLVVGKKKFPVHKLVLSARSPVFARMFSSSFRESKENRVVLEDMSEEVLQELLNFIYTERLNNLEKHASGLLMVAEKYQIESLKKICGLSLSTTINADTLLPLLQMATLYNVPELKSKCLTFFAGNSKEITLSEEWKELIVTEGNQEILGFLLQSVMRTK